MAVYTKVTRKDAEAFLERFDLGRLHAIEGIAEGVENSNYLLTLESGKAILTLFEKRVEEADLPFFMALKRHLAQKGIACPVPVADREGVTIGRLAGRPATVITFLEGKSPSQVELRHLRPLGETLARMHLAVKDFPLSRPNPLSLEGWRKLRRATQGRLDGIAAGLEALVEEEMAYLEAHWPTNLPQGVVHADLFPDNVFFEEGRLSGVIDFYFACTDFFAYDLAICLNSWCFAREGESWRLDGRKEAALMEGYRQVRPLSDAEAAALPILRRGAAMRFLMTRAYDWLNVPPGALVVPHNPLDYAARLNVWRGEAA